LINLNINTLVINLVNCLDRRPTQASFNLHSQVGSSYNFSTFSILLMENAKRELERMQWISQNKIPEYRQNTPGGSPILNKIKSDLGGFLGKQDNFIDRQENYLASMTDRAERSLAARNIARPNEWTVLEDKVAMLDLERENKIFALEMKYKSFPVKPAEYYRDALQLEYVNKKKIIQTWVKKEEHIDRINLSNFEGEEQQRFYHVLVKSKEKLQEFIQEIRAAKREVENFINSNIVVENPPVNPGSGSGEGSSGSGSGPSKDIGSGEGGSGTNLSASSKSESTDFSQISSSPPNEDSESTFIDGWDTLDFGGDMSWWDSQWTSFVYDDIIYYIYEVINYFSFFLN
jgi:hypothetical protein